ncbi:cadherin-like domain-containing protein [Vibrio lentus]|nr:cadherin-like domain-containing protein [Vibrio lentus]
MEAVNFCDQRSKCGCCRSPDGNFTITPSADFFGEIEFTYDVMAPIETVAADLNLTVNPSMMRRRSRHVFLAEDEWRSLFETELLAQATDVEGGDFPY